MKSHFRCDKNAVSLKTAYAKAAYVSAEEKHFTNSDGFHGNHGLIQFVKSK